MMVNNLINNGAKYVIIPNVFNEGVVPRFFNSVLYFTTLIANFILDADEKNTIFKTKYILPFGLNKNIFNIIKKKINYISREYYESFKNNDDISNITSNGAGINFIRDVQYTFNKKHNFLLGDFVVNIFKFLSYSTLNFNYFLEKELEKLNKNNIVFIDIYQLFDEIINNPKFYGIDDIILTNCYGFYDADDV